MIVTGITSFKDGGTIGIFTTEGNFFIDHRIRSTTQGELYNKYPGETREPIELTDDIKVKLCEGLRNYSSIPYDNKINQLIEELETDEQ